MTPDSFREELLRDGYLDIETKTMAPGTSVPLHSHPYDVRALVLAGEAVIDCGGDPRTFRPGDVVEVAGGVEHTENYGAQGYTFLVGRRHPKS